MPRYKFTIDDLKPFQPLLGRPEVQRIVSRAVPVKQFADAPKAVEALTDPLPVTLRTRENPGGVPLGDVSALVIGRVPGVSSMVVRDGSVLVTWSSPPTDDMRDALKKTLADKQALVALQDRLTKPVPENQDELKQELTLTTTSDVDWLRAFRRFQSAQLVAADKPLTAKPTRSNK